MVAQYAHTILRSAANDLVRLTKRVGSHYTRHGERTNDQAIQVNAIILKLDRLRMVVLSLKQTTESFRICLRIKEVGEFQEKLKKHMLYLGSGRYTTQLDVLDKFLIEQLHIFKSQKAIHQPQQIGLEMLWNMAAGVVEQLIYGKPAEDYKAKELFGDLYRCVHILRTNKVHFGVELNNIKSKLDDLKPLHFGYIEKIDYCHHISHLTIMEVCDYKKALFKGKQVCEDFQKEDNSLSSSAYTYRLKQLDCELMIQIESLTVKKRDFYRSFGKKFLWERVFGRS